MTPCPDCVRATREHWPVFTARLWCCDARSIAETVPRSGRGYTLDDVRRVLIGPVLARASEEEAAAFVARLGELGVSVEAV